MGVRLAKAINRTERLRGRVFGDRYHVHALKHPKEVRHAVAYVLLNAKKHGKKLRGYSLIPKGVVDPCSSGAWFDGWASQPCIMDVGLLSSDELSVAASDSFLMWKWRELYPPIALDESLD